MGDPKLPFFTMSPKAAFFVAYLADRPDQIVGTAGVFKYDQAEMQFTKLSVDIEYRRLGKLFNVLRREFADVNGK